MPSPVPVILCGKSPQIAAGAKDGLEPHYEVICVILSPAEGVSAIPALLRGETPPSSDSNAIGTHNYANKAMAVVTGGGYDDAAFSVMREACGGASNVPWLRPDMSKPTPPLGPKYGQHMIERVKTCLNKLVEEGKMQEDGIFFF